MSSAERSKRWRERHPERARELKRGQQAALLERDPDYYRRYAREHRALYAEASRKHYADRRKQVFDHYGWACTCCGSTDRPSIDHVGGDGGEHRQSLNITGGNARRVYVWLIKNGFPPGFQTMCLPCNQSKASGESCRLHGG